MAERDRMPMPAEWIVPAWPVASRVRAVMTTRHGGTSLGPWSAPAGGGMNLGLGSGDARAAVLANRALLERFVPSPPAWLHQVHGTRIVDAAAVSGDDVDADAAFSSRTGVVCAVL